MSAMPFFHPHVSIHELWIMFDVEICPNCQIQIIFLPGKHKTWFPSGYQHDCRSLQEDEREHH